MGYIGKIINWKQLRPKRVLVNGEIQLGTLDEKSEHAISRSHAEIVIECYIGVETLWEIAKQNGIQASEFLTSQVLPDNPTIISGDFGEILSRSVLAELPNFPVFPHLRWRDKEHKNDTVRGPDLLGYVCKDIEAPSKNDELILGEIKTRMASVNRDVVLEAFQETQTHYISQMANALFFVQAKLIASGQPQEAKVFARFSNPHEIPYKQVLSAIVVHESSTWDDDFLEKLPERHNQPDSVDFKVKILCVENFRNWVEEVFRAAGEVADG